MICVRYDFVSYSQPDGAVHLLEQVVYDMC